MTRQGVVLTAMLAGMCVLSHTRLYQDIANRSRGMIRGFPTTIASWQMRGEYAPSLREIELLETENILTRIYRDPNGREVSMVIVYDPSGNRKMAHPQEICLQADGLSTLTKSSVPLENLNFNTERLLMQRDRTRLLYYYWYKAGPHHSGNYITSQLRLAVNSLTASPGGTALIRLSTSAKDESAADQALQQFARDAMPQFDRYLP